MSVSSFHHHFKAVTAMSPLQFQKQIRLQEARRLMLSDDLDAASVGYRVGYNNTSHSSSTVEVWPFAALWIHQLPGVDLTTDSCGRCSHPIARRIEWIVRLAHTVDLC